MNEYNKKKKIIRIWVGQMSWVVQPMRIIRIWVGWVDQIMRIMRIRIGRVGRLGQTRYVTFLNKKSKS